MGAQQSRQQAIAFNPLSAGYTRINSNSGDIVWSNNTTGEELQEHHFLSSNERQFNYQLDAFNFRHNSPYLVSAQYLRKNIQSDLCGSIYSGEIFLERIPIRLSEFKQIPYPDVLYLYSQAFKGFDIVQRQVGPFDINEDLIGVNNQGLVKVWVNSDFTRSLPERSSIRMTEQGMVRKIVEIVNQNTYIPTTPINIRQFFEQRNPLTLTAAHSVLQEYAIANHVKIPTRLDCYLEAFKNPKIIDKAIITRAQQRIISPSLPIIGQTIAPLVPSTHFSQNIPRPTLINQSHISRPSTIYGNQVTRSISQPHLSSVITPTQQVLNSSVISKPITAGVTQVNTVSNVSRNIPLRSPSKYATNISSTLTTQQPSNINIVPQINRTALNITNQNRSLSSPIINRPIRTSPLFPKINSNAVRHQSLNVKPLTAGITTVKNNNIGKVGEIHHLFNRKTPSVLPNKASQNITFNNQRSALNSKLTTTNQFKSTSIQPNRPITFRPQQIISEKTNASHLNIAQKPLISQNKVTSIYQQAPKTGVRTNGLSGGIFDRIQKLNNKYFTQNNTSRFGYNNNVSANNYSSTYEATSSFTPALPITTSVPVTIPSYTPVTNTNYYNPYSVTTQKTFQTISNNYNRSVDISQPTVVETQTHYYNGTNYQNQHTPASIIKNIDYESKDVAYKTGQAIQLFDVERFTPNINEYSSAYLTSNLNNINQASGYIQSIYVPLEVNSAVESGYLPNHAPYDLNTGDLKYTQIHEQIYDGSPQANGRSYAYTSNYTQTYQTGGVGVTGTQAFGLNGSFGQTSSPYGNAYVSQSIQIESKNNGSPFKQSYFKQQQSTTTYQVNKISQGYRAAIDQDLLSDLQKIKAGAGFE